MEFYHWYDKNRNTFILLIKIFQNSKNNKKLSFNILKKQKNILSANYISNWSSFKVWTKLKNIICSFLKMMILKIRGKFADFRYFWWRQHFFSNFWNYINFFTFVQNFMVISLLVWFLICFIRKYQNDYAAYKLSQLA